VIAPVTSAAKATIDEVANRVAALAAIINFFMGVSLVDARRCVGASLLRGTPIAVCEAGH
jgi:hypothetical protein